VKPPSLTRATVLNFIDGAVTLAAALVVSILLARVLGPNRFGVYALAMTLVMVALLLARLGISSTVKRYVAELNARGDRQTASIVVGRGLRLGLASGAMGTALMAAAAAPLAAFFRHPELTRLLLIGAAMVLPMVVLGVLRNVVSGFQQYRYLVRLNLVASPAWVLGCAVALWWGAGVAGVMVTSLIVDLLQVLAVGLWVSENVGISWRAPLPEGLGRRLAQYNVTLAALIVLNAIVWERSELLFLGRFQGAEQVAFYALPFALTEKVVDLVPGALLGVLLPGLTYAQSIDPGRFSAVFSDALRYLAMLTLPICLFGIPLAPIMINLLYGSGYVGAVIVLQILLVSIVFGVLGQASRAAHLGMESQAFLLKTGLVAAAISIGLDLVLIPRFGATGAAVANTVVQALWALTITVPLWKRIGGGTGAAILKAAAVAILLAAILFVLAQLYPAAIPALLAGLLLLVAYAVALQRLNLLRGTEMRQFS
jgi:O-antigen/teichoic acid export membrane protein